MDIGLHLEQTQKLIITPELRQAIEILQLSTADLLEFTTNALMENPLLEAVEPENHGDEENRLTRTIDWEKYTQKSRESQERREFSQETAKETNFEPMTAKETTLEEHLLNQWHFMVLEKDNRRVGDYLIGNLNSCGYLSISVQQAAMDLRAPVSQVERTLQQLQTLDPAGVCARDLRECLLLQIDRQEMDAEEKKYLCTLIQDFLPEIAKGGVLQIAKAMNLTPAVVQGLVDRIKKLNPKPGGSFSSCEDTTYIIPDVVVEKDGEDFRIVLSESYMPQISINDAYAKVLMDQSQDDQAAKTFVETKLNQAAWLLRCFEQRRSTLIKVTEALIRRQRGFFERGISAMRPLTMREIAEEVGVHESTISRTASNKYIQTPFGVFEFKFLFTPGLENTQGGVVSTESIREMLREVIREEYPAKPYSDQQIAMIMMGRGVRIARRTVAKYREEMGIPSTALRRRY